MIKNGFNKSLAQKIWNWVIPFARYGFNKAHATAYAMIAYQTAYLKAHYPIEFMTILMNTEQKNLDRLRILLEETKKMKIEVLPPDINESLSKFTIVDNDNIRFGLTAIKNVGQNVVEKIVEERKKDGQFNSIENFVERMPKEVLNKKSIESLIKSGTFDNLEERGKLLYNLEKILEYARSSQKTKENGDMSLFGGGSSAVKIKLEENKEKITEDDKITWEKELLGVFVSSHPMDNFKEKVKNHLSINDLNHSFANQRVKVAGVISKIQKIITKQGEPMLFLEIEDLTGKIEILVFPGMLKENPLIFQENKVIEVKGRISDKDGDIKIITESAKEIKNGK
jgi:DNA polymerase-3 subunit alpha